MPTGSTFPFGTGRSESYVEEAFRARTAKRVDRLAETAGVLSVTIPVLTFMSSARRRPGVR
jgi:hypothetical protein